MERRWLCICESLCCLRRLMFYDDGDDRNTFESPGSEFADKSS